MKKLSLILAIAILFVAVFPLNAFAVKVGDEIGSVLNTDIKTYINGQRIPSYNINNKSAVFIKDLANYGFDTVFSEKNRTTTISYNPNKKATPLTSFDETTGKVGTVAFKYVYTNIVAVINGRSVECFNVKGYNAIYFSELEDFGTFAWNNAKRESRFTINNTQTKTETSIREKAKDGYWFSEASFSAFDDAIRGKLEGNVEYAKTVLANGSAITKDQIVGQWVQFTVYETPYADTIRSMAHLCVDNDGIFLVNTISQTWTFFSNGTFTHNFDGTIYKGIYEVKGDKVIVEFQTRNGKIDFRTYSYTWTYCNGKILSEGGVYAYYPKN